MQEVRGIGHRSHGTLHWSPNVGIWLAADELTTQDWPGLLLENSTMGHQHDHRYVCADQRAVELTFVFHGNLCFERV